MATKREVREQQLAKRLKLLPEEVADKSSAISRRVQLMNDYQNADEILIYAAMRCEVDLGSLVEDAWKNQKRVFFPKVSGASMEFYQVSEWDALQPGHFGVMEPDGSSMAYSEYLLQRASNAPCDVMLVPGLGFSADGYRVGYGKGYYDRYLTALRRSSCNLKLRTVGVCYEFQMIDQFETDITDVSLDRLVTEQREVKCYE